MLRTSLTRHLPGLALVSGRSELREGQRCFVGRSVTFAFVPRLHVKTHSFADHCLIVRLVVATVYCVRDHVAKRRTSQARDVLSVWPTRVVSIYKCLQYQQTIDIFAFSASSVGATCVDKIFAAPQSIESKLQIPAMNTGASFQHPMCSGLLSIQPLKRNIGCPTPTLMHILLPDLIQKFKSCSFLKFSFPRCISRRTHCGCCVCSSTTFTQWLLYFVQSQISFWKVLLSIKT